MSLINKSAVKEYVNTVEKGMRVSEDLFIALDDEITMHVQRAIKRAKENGRTTIKGRDL